MTQIAVSVLKNCKKHPLLKAGKKLPRASTLQISPKLLFSLATIRLQQPMKGRRTFKETEGLWKNLLALHGVELKFEKDNLVANTISSESVQNLSEIVGIGCGLAALRSEFNLNINRFTRYSGVEGKKRLDFEFFRGNKRFFHETKGTTNKDAVAGIRKNIEKQKESTKELNKKPKDGRHLSGCTGSIVLYKRSVGSTHDSSVELLDPPAAEDGLPAREADELSSVLRYYLNFYSVTYRDPENPNRVSIAEWLTSVVEDLESGARPPQTAPLNIFSRARIRERRGSSRYGGTLFDARLSRIAVRRFGTFSEATRTFENPVTFIGVAEDITAAIVECRWQSVLEFDDREAEALAKNGLDAVLESGILVERADLSTQEERQSSAAFAQLRARVERLDHPQR
jgi:hypothetical protein